MDDDTTVVAFSDSQGPEGAQGPPGPAGPPGPGLVDGGTTGQVLHKTSNTNQDASWHTIVVSDIADAGTAASADVVDFDVAGASATQMAAHLLASDPHGDRAYTDTVVVGIQLDDLFDVNLPSPNDGEALVWDSGSNSWISGFPVGGDVTDHASSHITGGSDVIPDATTSSSGLLSIADKTKLNAIESGATADQLASEVPFTAAGGLSSTNVQAALVELDSEKISTGASAGGILSGTYPNPAFAVDMATQTELDSHVNDSSDAHAASAISNTPAGSIAASNIQGAINELDSEKAALTGATFSGAIVVPDATSNTHALNRQTGDARYDSLGTASSEVSSHVGQSDPHTQYQKESERGISNGYASLDGNAKVPSSQLPSIAISDTYVVNSQAAMLALVADKGDVAIRTDISKSFILTTNSPGTLADWQELVSPTDSVTSVDGRTGVVSLTDLYDSAGTASSLVTAHINDTTDAHDASAVSFSSIGTIAASNVQAALEELDNDSRMSNSRTPTGTAGGVLTGTYPNPTFAADMATQTELDAHINDTIDAHDASAVSFVPAGTIASTDVQTAIQELDTDSRMSDARTPTGTAGGVLSGTYPNPGFSADMATQAELDAHINDTTDAHAASSITNTPAGNIAATTLQAAVNELDTEKATDSLVVHLAGTETITGTKSFSGDVTTQTGTIAQAVVGAVGPSSQAGLKLGSIGDVNLYRSGSNALATDDSLSLLSANLSGKLSFTTGTGIQEFYQTEANPRLRLSRDMGTTGGAGLGFGPGGATAIDTILYRSAAGVLKTDGKLIVSGGDVTLGTSTLIRSGSGSPEGSVTATVGSLYLRTDGATGTTLYRKESGSGNTGWVAAPSSLLVNVKDYGALGNNSANDYTAIANAIAACPAGGVVYFPPGQYKTQSTITVPPRITLAGGHAPHWPIYSDDSQFGTCIKPYSGSFTGTALIQFLDKTDGGYSYDYSSAQRLSWITLSGVSATGPAGAAVDGIYSAGPIYDVMLDHVTLNEFSGNGIHTKNKVGTSTQPKGWQFKFVSVQGCTKGYYHEDVSSGTSFATTDMSYLNCWSGANSDDGWHIDVTVSSDFSGCRSEFNGGYGYYIAGDSRVRFTNCDTDRSVKDGWHLECRGAGVRKIILNGCAANRDGANDDVTAAGYAGINIVGLSGSPHNPVILNACITDVNHNDAGAGIFVPEYGVKVAYAPQVSINGCLLTGTVSGLNDTQKQVSYDSTTRFNTASSVNGVVTLETSLGNTQRLIANAGTNRDIEYWTSTSGKRWALRCSSVAESGSNAGSNFSIARYDDSGNVIDTPFTITRSSGRTTFLSDIAIGNGPLVTFGTGSPETVVTAGVGSLYLRTDGGTGTTLYKKETGTGNTGWAAIATRLDQISAPTASVSLNSQKITSLADATTGTDALNRQTADARYESLADRTLNTQIADYTLVLGDATKTMVANKATAIAFTVPPNSSVAFPTGTKIPTRNIGVGILTISPGSGVTISGTTTIQQYNEVELVKTGTNAWLALHSGSTTSGSSSQLINVTSSPYNATGNGTTDDTTAIQAALDAAAATPHGAAVYFPDGTYMISNWLVYNSGISLVGNSADTVTIKNFTTRSGSTLMLRPNGTDVHDVVVQGITWDQRGDIYDAVADSTSEPLMDTSNTINMTVQKCYFKNVRTVGVYGDGTTAHPMINTKVLNNHVFQAGGDGISFFGTLIDAVIDSNTVEHTQDDAIAVQDHVSSSEYPTRCLIVNNTILDCDSQTTYGSTPNGIYVFGGDRTLVANNYIKNVYGSCIKVGVGSGRNSSYVTVLDNQIGGAGTNNLPGSGTPAHGVMLNGVDNFTISGTRIVSSNKDYNFSFFDYSANTGIRVVRDGGLQTVTYASSVTPNPLNGETIMVTLTGNITFTAPSVAVSKPGGRMILQVTQDGTGGRTVTLSGIWKGTWVPSLTANAISSSEWQFDGTNWVLQSTNDGRFEPISERTLNTQTNDYTLVLADATKTVVANKATAIAFTIPPNSSVAFPVGTRILHRNIGAGLLTVTPGSGVTINGSAIVQRYNEVAFVKTATDTWQALRSGVPYNGAISTVDLNGQTLTNIADASSSAHVLNRSSGDSRYTELSLLGGILHLLDTGIETIPGARALNSSNTISMTSGSSRLTYFMAWKTITVTQIKLFSGNTVSSGLTIARAAIHSVDGSGNTTVLASTTNDTSLFAATNTAYTKNLSTSVTLNKGSVYAFELLELGTPGQKLGVSAFSGAGGNTGTAAHMIDSPRVCALINGQTDIGTGYTTTTIAASTNAGATSSFLYAVLLP